jgi:hypothetical protein
MEERAHHIKLERASNGRWIATYGGEVPYYVGVGASEEEATENMMRNKEYEERLAREGGGRYGHSIH